MAHVRGTKKEEFMINSFFEETLKKRLPVCGRRGGGGEGRDRVNILLMCSSLRC